MKSWKILAIAAAFAGLSSAASAVTLVESGGVLMGANGIAFEGGLYDILFVDGTCASTHGGICASPFDSNDASAPGLTTLQRFGFAMLDQVFPEGIGYDLTPELINGCSTDPNRQCQIHMPGLAGQGPGFRATVLARANNTSSTVNPITTIGDTSSLAYANFGVITVSAVPLPASLPLLAGGLGLIAALRRRRRKA